jgi:hypothetical protein
METLAPKDAPKTKRSLFFSLLVGNWVVEAGSTATASASKLEKAMRGKRTNIFAAALIATRVGLPADDLRKALAPMLGGNAKSSIKLAEMEKRFALG